MTVLHRQDGSIFIHQTNIHKEVIDFYGNIMGKVSSNLKHVNIEVMRSGRQLNMERREYLVGKVTDEEIVKALQRIGDLEAPKIDGYGVKLFKTSWHIIKSDVTAAIQESF
ncbi:unnamed protein product [Lathyrus sativus]|nr:unnamed protein product [Lathyrus sativus]